MYIPSEKERNRIIGAVDLKGRKKNWTPDFKDKTIFWERNKQNGRFR